MIAPLLLLAFVGFVALGLPDGALGVAWPSISTDLGRSLGELGRLLALQTVGYLAASIWAERLGGRSGTAAVLITSSGLAIGGLLGFGLAGHWWLLVVASTAIGISGGLIDAGLNAYVGLHGTSRVMNLLHASFGIGATLGPVLMTIVLSGAGSWRPGFLAIAPLHLALVVGFWRTRGRWGRLHPETHTSPHPSATRLGGRGLWLSLALFFLYTGVEVAAGQWSFTMLTEHRNMGSIAAGYWVAAYWGSFTAARIVAGLLGDRVPASAAIRAGTVVALAGAAGFWWSGRPWVGAVGLVAMGVGLAPIFPALMVLTPVRFGTARAARVVGYQLAAARLGVAALPGGIGLAVDGWGTGSIGPGVFAGAAVLLGLAELNERWTARLGAAGPA